VSLTAHNIALQTPMKHEGSLVQHIICLNDTTSYVTRQTDYVATVVAMSHSA